MSPDIRISPLDFLVSRMRLEKNISSVLVEGSADPKRLDSLGRYVGEFTLGEWGALTVDKVTKVYDPTGFNCYAACASTITGVPFGELSLSELANESLSDSEKHNRATSILQKHGWWRCRLRFNAPLGFSIANGPSPRGKVEHAVVCQNGEFFHDPHASGAFLEVVSDYEFLVPLKRKLQ